MRTTLAAVLLATASASAFAQATYTFEMRLIADGQAGAPTSGTYPSYPLNIFSEPAATRIGFWLQARVAVTGNAENWGIVRAASPAGGASFLQLTTANPDDASLSRGSTGGNGTVFGRGAGYRNGGTMTGNTGNTGDSQPFPGTGGNENGGLDNGGSGSLTRRVYGFDSYVGLTRNAVVDEDGVPSQPWGVNGALSGASIGNPVPSNGTFSPWASLYRVWVDMPTHNTDLVLIASAYLTGSLRAVPTDASQNTWEMQEGAGQLMTAYFSIHIPTPAAGSVLVMASVFAARRRRD